MKTTITLLLSSIFLLGCGSRNKNLAKTEDNSMFENSIALQQNNSASSNTSSITDIRNFLISNGLKIKSTGQNYELKYGDLTFSGSADLEFTENKEETIMHHVYQIHTTYITDTKYQTKTFFKTNRISKDLNVQRSGISFGYLIGIIVSSMIGGVVLWELIKRLKFKI